MFSDKTAFVTGGTGSIGQAICNDFIKNNCSNIFSSTTNLEKAKNIDDQIKFINLDLKNITQDNLKENINFEPDFLILNAGLNRDNLFLRMKSDQWNDVINVNLSSNFYIIKQVLPGMIKAKSGKIIGITSVVAATGNSGQANYTASKSGMIGMYKSLALEIAQRNINVNLIAPGFIESPMTNKLNEDQKKAIMNKIPMKKFGNPIDIANIALFLASNQSSYITGQTIHVNGGMIML